jgi:NAD(P)-dependent dehydrogenase (short-subunit alcohol dehydrogenase family)
VNMDLDGAVAVITGAGGGIGRSMALAFASQGASIVVADIDAPRPKSSPAKSRCAMGPPSQLPPTSSRSSLSRLSPTAASPRSAKWTCCATTQVSLCARSGQPG